MDGCLPASLSPSPTTLPLMGNGVGVAQTEIEVLEGVSARVALFLCL